MSDRHWEREQKKRYSNQEEIEIKCDFKSHGNLQFVIHSPNATIQTIVCVPHDSFRMQLQSGAVIMLMMMMISFVIYTFVF